MKNLKLFENFDSDIQLIVCEDIKEFKRIFSKDADYTNDFSHFIEWISNNKKSIDEYEQWIIYLIKYKDKYIGTISVVNAGSYLSEYWLSFFTILNRYRRLGIGQKVINIFIKKLKKIKSSFRLMLQVDKTNKGAQNLYLRCVFKFISIDDYIEYTLKNMDPEQIDVEIWEKGTRESLSESFLMYKDI